MPFSRSTKGKNAAEIKCKVSIYAPFRGWVSASTSVSISTEACTWQGEGSTAAGLLTRHYTACGRSLGEDFPTVAFGAKYNFLYIRKDTLAKRSECIYGCSFIPRLRVRNAAAVISRNRRLFPFLIKQVFIETIWRRITAEGKLNIPDETMNAHWFNLHT